MSILSKHVHTLLEKMKPINKTTTTPHKLRSKVNPFKAVDAHFDFDLKKVNTYKLFAVFFKKANLGNSFLVR